MGAGPVRRRALVPAVIGASFLVLAACSSAPVVSREEVDADIDLSGYWNDSDSRRVAEEMIGDAASRPWAEEFAASRGRKPTVIVGGVRNLSHEHLNTRTFVKDLEREWVQTGRVRLVASRDERDGREDQSRHASLETAKSMGRELGADFMLLGQIDSILDSAEGESVRFYQVELELIDIETNEKAWIGQKKLKKRVSRKRFRF
jgi:PBP1b-binding outer membrane lipoprotein LpoB